MKNNSAYRIILSAFCILHSALFVSCSDYQEKSDANDMAVELTGVETVIGNMTVSSRGDAGNGTTVKKRTTGYIGREIFVANDQMTITKFQRTDVAMTSYSYKDISFKSNDNQSH